MTSYIKYHEIDNNPETNIKLKEIVDSLAENGWQGYPLLAIGDQLLTGCHRATACKILDIEPVVHQAIIAEAKDEVDQYYIDELADCFDTETLYRAIKALYDEGLVDDYSLEIIAAEYTKES